MVVAKDAKVKSAAVSRCAARPLSKISRQIEVQGTSVKNLLHDYPLLECLDFNIDWFAIRQEIDLLCNKCQVHALRWNGRCYYRA